VTPFEFLSAIWPEEGLYCIATPYPKGGYGHRVCETIEDAAEYVTSIKDTKDIYFNIHSLKEARLWNAEKKNPKTGETGAWEVRVQRNMRSAKAFFFDLDVGESEQKYQTQREAIFGLKSFLVETGLPAPLLTSSGGGLHVYWLLDSSLDSNTWKAVAAQLKALAHTTGLKIDNARTTDTSSVLRVAGTFNHKRGEKRPVLVLAQGKPTDTERFRTMVGTAVVRLGAKVEAPAAATQAHNILGTQEAIEYDGPPVSPMAVAKACAQVQYLVKSQGNVPEPLWYHGIIGILRFTSGGRELVHKVSKGHPGYTHDGCEAKIDSHEARRGSDGRPLGPTGCAKLRAELPPEQAKMCETCPFEGKVHGPINAARFKDDAPSPTIVEAVGAQTITTAIPPPPKPYTRMNGGGISVYAKDKDGNEMHSVIYPNDLYPIRRLVNSQSQVEQQMWRVVLPREGSKDFVIDADALYDRRKFVTTISNQGIYPSGGNIQLLQEYMVAYIAELQKLADAEAQCNHLGWTAEQTQFIMPDKILLQDGTAKPAMLSLGAQRASAQVFKKGTLQRQIELLKFYDHPAYVANQFFILGSLAAPLFYMTGQHGIIVNASGDAGASKSTSLYTAASIWGSPELYPMNGTNDGATVRGRNERVTTLANLPICVDEITHIPIKEAKDLAMSITQPGHRIRLSTDGVERSATGSYKATVMLATANSSLHNLLSVDNSAGTAGSMRVFEIVFRSMGVHKKHEADDYLYELKQNFGHIGEVFVSYVLMNQAAIQDRIRVVMKEVDELCDIQSGERFWSAYIATVLVACEIANKLGILGYNRDVLSRWAVESQVPFMRGIVVEEYNNPIGVLSDYLDHINGDMIVVKKPLGQHNIPNVVKTPRGQLLAHYDVDDNLIWVAKKPFKDYCTRIGANSLRLLNELHESRVDRNGDFTRVVLHKHAKKVLGAGTEHAKAQTWCFSVNMRHPEVNGAAKLTVVEGMSEQTGVSAANLKLLDGAV